MTLWQGRRLRVGEVWLIGESCAIGVLALALALAGCNMSGPPPRFDPSLARGVGAVMEEPSETPSAYSAENPHVHPPGRCEGAWLPCFP